MDAWDPDEPDEVDRRLQSILRTLAQPVDATIVTQTVRRRVRRRRDVRRGAAVLAGSAVALGTVVAALHFTGSAKPTRVQVVSPTPLTVSANPAAAPSCPTDDLRLRTGPLVSEATGQHTLDLILTNTSRATCTLTGYPAVSLLDRAGHTIPFRYTTKGDQMTVSGPAPRVVVAPGEHAYIRIDKYRCDIASQISATALRLIPPDAQTSLTVTLGKYPTIDYCPETSSLSVAVSPFEPSIPRLYPNR